MRTHQLCCAIVLGLGLFSAQAQGQSSTPGGPLRCGEATSVSWLTGESIESECKAYCEDGSSITVFCPSPSSCTAVDQNCAAGIRGYASCNGTRGDCPPCPTVCAQTTCPDGTVIACYGSDCSGGNGACWVTCNGVTDWCPGYEHQIWCG